MKRAALLCIALAGCSTFGAASEGEMQEGGIDATTGGPDAGGDALGPNDSSTASDAPPNSGKLVFVTKAVQKIVSSFKMKADGLCNAEGRAARPGKTFVAWLSTPTDNAIAALPNEGVWKLANGSDVVFDSLMAITSGATGHKIDEHADGTTVTLPAFAWTNSKANGTPKYTDGGLDCQSLTSAMSIYTARVGNPAVAMNSAWTDDKDLACDQAAAFICFEQ